MPNYESYRDVLTEHAVRRHEFGSSIFVILLVLAAAVAVSII